MRQPRSPAVAGSFYPADPTELGRVVDRLLDAVPPVPEGAGNPPVALVVPHAALACSGAVAATAYRRLPRVRTVAVIGPGHHHDPRGLAIPACHVWETPLGPVSIAPDVCDVLEAAGLVHRSDRAHAREHSIEVQLPFLERILGGAWELVPIVAGEVPPSVIADCLDALYDTATFPIVSTDLSHYLDDATARQQDRRTADAVVARNAAGIADGDACGAVPLRGLLAWAERHGLRCEVLDLGTSADTCAGPDRVVGYGAFVVTDAHRG